MKRRIYEYVDKYIIIFIFFMGNIVLIIKMLDFKIMFWYFYEKCYFGNIKKNFIQYFIYKIKSNDIGKVLVLYNYIIKRNQNKIGKWK